MDDSLSAEDDFQRQLENDSRELSLQMEAACTRIQARRRRQARGARRAVTARHFPSAMRRKGLQG